MEEEKKEVIEVQKVENAENVKSENIKTEESKKDKKGFCIASLVLGIVTLIFFCIWYISIPCGILSIVFGIIGLKSVNRGMAIAGLITGSIGLVISALIVIFLFMIGFTIGITDALNEIDFDEFRTHIEDYKYDYDTDYNLYE